ncbi:uncharacterized protein RCO7_11740 [Rhynchosporium graminicola]|uniref:Tat pathway signal sequence n=1 Tax=Rhynchosporium graminicola TaxID=2792576 RepID=A0A1E1LRR7_9HELO|nr:uncharacterized protein RCO7_11740 [Rhynchosporium commune]
MDDFRDFSGGSALVRSSLEQESTANPLLEEQLECQTFLSKTTNIMRVPMKRTRQQLVLCSFDSFSRLLPWLLLLALLIWNMGYYQRSELRKPMYPQLTYSPVQHLLEYEERVFQLGFAPDTTEYQGQPSPELDEKWLELYRMGISRVPLETAKHLINKTVLFPHDEEKNYVIELDVFHQLHCLNMIRKALHPDYYKPHMIAADGEDELLGFHHIDHCVDTIRQSLMCSVDVSVLTWEWNEERQQNLEKGAIVHTCRNFDKVRDWAKTHAIDQWFDLWHHEINDPLDTSTWEESYTGE